MLVIPVEIIELALLKSGHDIGEARVQNVMVHLATYHFEH
jgi:hypothetical protein